MNNWYSDALKYANRLATNSGGWKEGEQEEVEKVLSFISGMHDKATEDSEEDSLYNVFENGYCYYFAQILNFAFPALGQVVWIRNHGHIVWQSYFSGICYDVSGIYTDYEEYDLVEVGRLGSLLVDFLHTNKEYYCWHSDFKTWCEKYNFKPLLAIAIIYKNLPELSGKSYEVWDEFNWDVEYTVFRFWDDSKANKKACLHTIEAELRKGKF